MKKRLMFTLIFAGIIIFSVGSALASIDYKNNTLKKVYMGGEIISGKINLSIDAEKAHSLLTSNFEGSTTLLDLLVNNGFSEGQDYECSVPGCLYDYEQKEQINSLSEPGIIGFKLTGENVRVQSINFSISGSSISSCSRQLLLKFADDYYMQNYNYENESCGSAYYGCFSSNLSSSDYIYPEIPAVSASSRGYCEKIHLPAAPGFALGASVKNSTVKSGQLKMKLYDRSGNSLNRECVMPSNAGQNFENLSCNVDFNNVNESDFYVCISADSGTNYMIRAEREGSACGTVLPGSDEFNADYEIFAKPLAFGGISIDVNANTFSKFNNADLSSLINSYLTERYNGGSSGADCSSDCYIPIEVKSLAQEISFNNLQVKYLSSGLLLTENRMYSLDKEDSEIDSGWLPVEMKYANFSIPITSTQNKFELFNNENIVLTIPINVSAGFEFDVTPSFSLLGIDTTFRVVMAGNITSSTWNFGDNSSAVTVQGKSVVHKFTKAGEYDIGVEVAKGSVKSAKDFTILVGNANESANILIRKYDARLINASSQITSSSGWASEYVKNNLNIGGLSEELGRIKTEFLQATSTEDYEAVVNKLLKMDVPVSVSIIKTGNPPLLAAASKLDSDYILQISDADSSRFDSDKLKNSILGWIAENYDANVDFKQLGVSRDSGSEAFMTIVKITLNPKIEQTYTPYFIIGHEIEGIKFAADYGEKAVGSATEIILSGKQQDIEFAISEDVEIEDLGIYASPEVSRLGSAEIIGPGEDEGFKTLWFIIWTGILILATFIAYIILQEWYKKHYESHLFKNRDELYNIINFIYNSRFKFSDSDIKKKLSDSGWTAEQITYAFKKIDGKRTGMWEIPLFKFGENRVVVKEIEKRQGRPIDTRFIKRTNP